MRYILMIGVLLLLVGSVLAQDEAITLDFNCPDNIATEQVNNLSAVIESFNAGDLTAVEFLLEIRTQIGTIESECLGYTYSNETHPNGIIGPISFSGTLYQMTISADDFVSMNAVELEGDCGLLFPLSNDPMDGGEETDLWEMEDNCDALLEVDGMADTWTLVIEPLR